jgi:small conductance mechanosensitive channel
MAIEQSSGNQRKRFASATPDRSTRLRRGQPRATLPRVPTARPRLDARNYRAGAQQRLRRFRQGSTLAVALTALLLLTWGAPVPLDGADGAGASTVQQQPAAELPSVPDPSVAVEEATTTIRALLVSFYGYLPRLLLALLLIGVVAVVGRVTGAVLRRTLGAWERAAAVTAVTRLALFLAAAVAAISILAGDARAVVGSVGLLGLAASWALQTPIESFTGWLLNSFRTYYRVGDRIAVGDVFGDVYRIDVLTTTVWEAGGRGKAVAAAQSTGALITFPNWEILRSNIVNYSRDFPYVWDEITIGVANESDLAYCIQVIESTARRVIGDQMEDAAQQYEELLRSHRLAFDVDEVPKVYLSAAESWTDCTLRYLVPVRTRRGWASTLTLEVSRELAKPEHAPRIIPSYPRREVIVRRVAGGGD